MAPPWRATSFIMMAASVTPRPEPPNSVGMVMPSQPPSAMARVELTRELAVLVARQPVGIIEARTRRRERLRERRV